MAARTRGEPDEELGGLAWLSDLFARSGGGPVTYGDRRVHAVYRRQLAGPTRVEIAVQLERAPADLDVRQGLRIAVDGGELELYGERHGGMELWTDLLPRPVTIACLPARDGAELAVWNVWDVEGLACEWVGQSGMLIEGDGDDVVLRCSNGLERADFGDLVVRVRCRPITRPMSAWRRMTHGTVQETPAARRTGRDGDVPPRDPRADQDPDRAARPARARPGRTGKWRPPPGPSWVARAPR
jgi:hypothetical protein